MANYARDEQETTINFEYADRERWRIYTTYPPHIRKVMEIGDVLRTETDSSGQIIAVDAYIEFNQVWLVKRRS